MFNVWIWAGRTIRRPRLDFTSLPQTSNLYRSLHFTMDRKDGQGHSDSLVPDIIRWHILSSRISSRKYWMQDLVDPAKALLPKGRCVCYTFLLFSILCPFKAGRKAMSLDWFQSKCDTDNPSMIIIKYVLYWTICACTCICICIWCIYIYTCTYMYRYFIHDTHVTSSKNMQ